MVGFDLVDPKSQVFKVGNPPCSAQLDCSHFYDKFSLAADLQILFPGSSLASHINYKSETPLG
ncbi:hypothetical protein A3K71_03365 [archaeon RBG_16_50_20]|nr:MAG: hypothetical protein A3K71_03365 [archaeon RBG_16_50_20]